MNIFEKVKDQVKIADVVERYGLHLNSSMKALCPFHHEKTPSFSVDPKNGIFTCFGCGETGDVISFVSKMENIEPLEAARKLADMYNIDIEEFRSRPTIKEYLQQCIRDVSKTDYFQTRGLTDETVKKYCLGYDVKKDAVVIPYSSELRYYQRRSVKEKRFYKPTVEDAGSEPLFNQNGLYGNTKSVFIVESPICALSIMQCGSPAVALCGVQGKNKLVKCVTAKKPSATLILCLDNDEAGKTATNSLTKELDENDVKYVVYNVAKDCKDPNELLVKKGSLLKASIELAKKEVKKKYAVGFNGMSANELILANIEPPNWIIPNILPQGLAILCASSKVGKSWMALQMCMAVSEGENFLNYPTIKNGCLYLALEDSYYRLKDRLSKMRPDSLFSKEFYLGIKAQSMDAGLFDQLQDELAEHPKIKLVIIDTLQKVRGQVRKNELAYATDYRELGKLKEFADSHKICILLIHHLRKMADSDDVFNMISGSNGIMGVCDSIFIIYKKKRTDETAVLHMTGRDVRQQDIVINYNEKKYNWEIVQSPEELAKKRERQRLIEDPVVITLQHFIKTAPYKWEGTATDLIQAICDVTGRPYCGSARELGKKITDLDGSLYSLGIQHSSKRSGKERRHIFTKVVKKVFAEQHDMFEDDGAL